MRLRGSQGGGGAGAHRGEALPIGRQLEQQHGCFVMSVRGGASRADRSSGSSGACRHVGRWTGAGVNFGVLLASLTAVQPGSHDWLLWLIEGCHIRHMSYRHLASYYTACLHSTHGLWL